MRRYAAYLPALIPYVAIGLGLYVFRSVWIIAAVYYSAVLGCVVVKRRLRLFAGVFEGFNWSGLIISVVGGIVVFGAILLVWPFAVRPGTDVVGLLAEYGLGRDMLAWFAVGALLVNPLMEELLWRGVLEGRSGRIGWIDAAFGGYHVPVLVLVLRRPWVVVGFVGLCGVSWVFRYAKHRFGGLAIPLIGHFLADLAVVVSVYCSI